MRRRGDDGDTRPAGDSLAQSCERRNTVTGCNRSTKVLVDLHERNATSTCRLKAPDVTLADGAGADDEDAVLVTWPGHATPAFRRSRPAARTSFSSLPGRFSP